MAHSLKLMEIFAHPDDESLSTGGTLVKYAAEGIETSLVTATRGERGWWGSEADYPGPEALGRTREAKLRAAAQELGLRVSSGREWIGEGVSPFQASLKADQGGVSQWVSRIRYTPVVAGDPKFMYQNEYKVTVNANGELVVERLADPMEDAFRCLSKK